MASSIQKASDDGNETISSEKLPDCPATTCNITNLHFSTNQHNIDIKTETELDIGEIKVKSEVFFDFGDECYEYGGKITNTDDFDSYNKNIEIKYIPGANIEEKEVKSEVAMDTDNGLEFIAVKAEPEIDTDDGSVKSIKGEVSCSTKCGRCNNIALTNASLYVSMHVISYNEFVNS